MWGKTMSSFLLAECTESANICAATPTAQTANTSLTDEAKVHLRKPTTPSLPTHRNKKSQDLTNNTTS